MTAFRSETSRVSLTQSLQQLYTYIKDYRDSHFRLLAQPFVHLPSRLDYPDYYEIIRKPIDLVKIQQKIVGQQYHHLEEMSADCCLMCDNACRYNEPDSLIYKVRCYSSTLVYDTWVVYIELTVAHSIRCV